MIFTLTCWAIGQEAMAAKSAKTLCEIEVMPHYRGRCRMTFSSRSEYLFFEEERTRSADSVWHSYISLALPKQIRHLHRRRSRRRRPRGPGGRKRVDARQRDDSARPCVLWYVHDGAPRLRARHADVGIGGRPRLESPFKLRAGLRRLIHVCTILILPCVCSCICSGPGGARDLSQC